MVRQARGGAQQVKMDTTPVTVQLVSYIGSAVVIAVGIVLWVAREFAKRDKEIFDHKLHVAETYATKEGLKESFNRVHDAIDNLTSRIDLVLRSESRPPVRRRQDLGE